MFEWRAFFENILVVFNLLLISYFVVGNGVYTLLMCLSLASVWLRSRGLTYQSLSRLRKSTTLPPVTVIIPACNEQDTIIQALSSALQADYPGLEVLVVDDGSADLTMERLTRTFGLQKIKAIERPRLKTMQIHSYYRSSRLPQLSVISKENGGKPDALNAGINHCQTPYFCILDADCVLERDALLRLMGPIIQSPVNTVVSGGIVRILNGCDVQDGQVVKIGLPPKVIERFQVVEYLRSFLFGRTGWDLAGGTMLVSGAFAVFHLETVAEAGGFSTRTVTEDMELVVRIHRWAAQHGRRIRMSFTSDPVCWSECPRRAMMLARQRRRWQLGLCQTLWINAPMLFSPRYGVIGMLSYPFHLYVEAMGAVVEFLGYLLIPVSFLLKAALPRSYLPFLALGLAYSAFLSIGAVVLEELTHRRYASFRELCVLLFFAVSENFGYRQLVVWFRFQGVMRFLTGFRQWEKVAHLGAAAREPGAVARVEVP